MGAKRKRQLNKLRWRVAELAAELRDRIQDLEFEISNNLAKGEDSATLERLTALTVNITALNERLAAVELAVQAISKGTNELDQVHHRLDALEQHDAAQESQSAVIELTDRLELLEAGVAETTLDQQRITSIESRFEELDQVHHRLDALEQHDAAQESQSAVIELTDRLELLEARVVETTLDQQRITSIESRFEELDLAVPSTAPSSDDDPLEQSTTIPIGNEVPASELQSQSSEIDTSDQAAPSNGEDEGDSEGLAEATSGFDDVPQPESAESLVSSLGGLTVAPDEVITESAGPPAEAPPARRLFGRSRR